MGEFMWVWWLLAALVLAAIALAVWRAKRTAAAREEAVRLRGRAASSESMIEERESTAREREVAAGRARAEADEAQAQADAARRRADELQARAAESAQAARNSRNQQVADLEHADDIDPDTPRRDQCPTEDSDPGRG